jgi:hypothetical protein
MIGMSVGAGVGSGVGLGVGTIVGSTSHIQEAEEKNHGVKHVLNNREIIETRKGGKLVSEISREGVSVQDSMPFPLTKR